MELPFRGHTRDQDKCPLNRVVVSLEVTGTTIRQGNPDFSRHLQMGKVNWFELSGGLKNNIVGWFSEV